MNNIATKPDVKLALVVDDSQMQCKVLSILLKEEGYRVFTANDGARAVDMYVKYHPDLVLMDINMPVMNGHEAARKIKSVSKENCLCPLIFITSMDTDQAFIESIEAGGDGILVRPFSPEVFKAKIKSIQRISDLYSQVKSLQQEQQDDAELAEKLMSGVIESRNFALDRIGIVKEPATLFSGDIHLTADCPNGDVNVLLGDFTGHGLRSSIGAITLSETFRAMSKKGFSLLDIVRQINSQLADLLPADLFLAAAFVTVSSTEESAYVFNAGLPDVYIMSGQGELKRRVPSSHPPIGVLPELLPDSQLTVFSVLDDDRVILVSDGIVEARNSQGDMFDYSRLIESAKSGVINQKVCESVLAAVHDFCEGMPQEDDISLIDIPCGGWHQSLHLAHIKHAEHEKAIAETLQDSPVWQWRLTLSGKRLALVNPVPIAMNQVKEIEGHNEHWQNLYTILTELFVNALDHGVLELSSSLKTCSEGFSLYFKEREKRLKALTEGYVDFKLAYYTFEYGGKFTISIKDSGKGFNAAQFNNNIVDECVDSTDLSGRGLILVKQLCDSLKFHENGSLVEASYVWTN